MRAKWLAKKLLPICKKIAEERDPDFTIVRGSDAEVYMKRWWLIPRNRLFNVYLHCMLGDDDAVMHDHMYASLSLVLTRGLGEKYCRDPRREFFFEQDLGTGNWDRRSYWVQSRSFQAGDVIYRSRHFAHQLLVESPAWTIFVTGPRLKEWGFWCPRGWKHFKDYVRVTGKTSKISEGCGEV